MRNIQPKTVIPFKANHSSTRSQSALRNQSSQEKLMNQKISKLNPSTDSKVDDGTFSRRWVSEICACCLFMIYGANSRGTCESFCEDDIRVEADWRWLVWDRWRKGVFHNGRNDYTGKCRCLCLFSDLWNVLSYCCCGNKISSLKDKKAFREKFPAQSHAIFLVGWKWSASSIIKYGLGGGGDDFPLPCTFDGTF